MLNFKFKKNVKYLIPANFGLSSMVLVDMALKDGLQFAIANVMYDPKETNDVKALREFCESKGIEFHFMDATKLEGPAAQRENEDFAKFARRTRYAFFGEVYRKINAQALILAHCQDDLLESYLFQRNHDRAHAKYGMSDSAIVDGMIVIRPLLNMSRPDIEDYAIENQVHYSRGAEEFEQEVTEDDAHRQVASLSEIDRENLLEEMRFKNDEKIKLQKEFAEKIVEGEELDIRALIALSKDGFTAVLLRFVSHSDDPIELKPETIDKIREFCLSPIPNDSFFLAGHTYLIKEYDMLTLGNRYDELPYTYVLEKPSKLETPNFYLDFTMGAEDRGIHEEDYPLTIRSALPYDTYVVHGYLESVLRLYSTWQMPVRLRHIWPIFVNKNGKIVYVPRYRRNFSEERTSILRMNVKDDER